MASGSDCVYIRNALPTSNNAAVCGPSLTFRRVMLNQLQPSSLLFRNLWVTDLATNLSTYVYFQHYNEDGYQFTLPTTRQYWMHWDLMFRLDPTNFVYHKMDPLDPSNGYVYLSDRFLQQVWQEE